LARKLSLALRALGRWRETGMTAHGVRRAKAALSSGCKPARRMLSNQSSYGGNEVAEAFD
jgi:hypothetical protein